MIACRIEMTINMCSSRWLAQYSQTHCDQLKYHGNMLSSRKTFYFTQKAQLNTNLISTQMCTCLLRAPLVGWALPNLP